MRGQKPRKDAHSVAGAAAWRRGFRGMPLLLARARAARIVWGAAARARMMSGEAQRGVAPALPSASVVVTREADGPRYDFEVLLMRRHGGSSFMPGLFVFPGGKMDESDCLEEWNEVIGTEDVGLPPNGPLCVPEVAGAAIAGIDHVGLRISAARELFEEAGVLLRSPGDSFGPHTVSDIALMDWRSRVHADGSSFLAMARDGLRLPLAALTPWMCIVTPRAQPKRFQTWFYLLHLARDGGLRPSAGAFRSPSAAGAAAGLTAAADGDELTDLLWLAPDDALDRHAAGDLPLAPPQFYMLRRMLEHRSAAGLAAAARAAADAADPPFHVCEPWPRRAADGSVAVLLPGDAEYGGFTPPAWRVGHGARNRLRGDVLHGGPYAEERTANATPHDVL